MGRGIYPGAGHRGFAAGTIRPAQQGHRVGSDVYNGTTERVFTNMFIKAVKHELKVESRQMRDEHRAPRRAQTQFTNLAMTTSGGCCALRQAARASGWVARHSISPGLGARPGRASRSAEKQPASTPASANAAAPRLRIECLPGTGPSVSIPFGTCGAAGNNAMRSAEYSTPALFSHGHSGR